MVIQKLQCQYCIKKPGCTRLIIKVLTATDYKLPLSSCSRSIASNRALKLPAPKDRAPLR